MGEGAGARVLRTGSRASSVSRALKEVPDVLIETILAIANMLLSIPGDTVTLSRTDLMLLK